MTNTSNTESTRQMEKDLMINFEKTWLELVDFHSNKMEYYCTQHNYLTKHRRELKKSNKEMYIKTRRQNYKKYAAHRRFLILLARY